MAKKTFRVEVLPRWRESGDPLLKALVKKRGHLLAAIEAVGGQAAMGEEGPESLHLWRTPVGDEGMEALAGLTGVTEFESSERMTDACLVHLRGMAKLERITLNGMEIAGDGLRHLAGMTVLRQLQLCACTLSDAAMAHLPSLPSLTMLNLSSSTGCTSAALACLERLPALTAFHANGAPVAGPGLRHLASLPHLTDLDLSGGGERITTDADLSHLPLLPTVEHLDLRSALVTDAGLAHLARLPNVRWVLLDQAALSDAGIPHLAALPNLRQASLDRTKVTIAGVRALQAARPGIHVSAKNCTGDRSRKPKAATLICRPEQREAAPVAESWRRIEAWFAANLPEALATLRPPATEADLAAVEARIGQPLPADFRASYLIHDGQDVTSETCGLGILFGRHIVPLRHDCGDSVMWLYEHRVEHEWPPEHLFDYEEWEYLPPDSMRKVESGPGWVPFYYDSGRNYIGIDLEPGPNGVRGQVIPFGTDYQFRPVLAQSFGHLLEDIADELEASSAITRPRESSHDVFNLRGGFDYKRWAEAKLPLAFQQAEPGPRDVPEDRAVPVEEPLASELVGVVRAFLEEMNAYERRWLGIRPIRDWGVDLIQEQKDGISGWSFTRRDGEAPTHPVQAVLWDEKATRVEQHEALEEGKHFKRAIAEKRAIWRRHLTPGKRPFSGSFIQHARPAYDPASLVDPDVRMVGEGHALITVGAALPPDACGTGRIRWHLRLHRGKWRIERHEGVDDPAKPRRLDLA
ncbi:MAG: SMI1/KNR4 family protein [Gemmataceae bacterium]|nr:SMI1/KNR4 family protein [Gemmataceae bacterium]